MPDKVKPLKIESSSTGGTQNDWNPTELNPSEDYLATKGVAFENSDNILIDHDATNGLRFKDVKETAYFTFRQLRTALNNIFDIAANGFQVTSTNVQAAIEEAKFRRVKFTARASVETNKATTTYALLDSMTITPTMAGNYKLEFSADALADGVNGAGDWQAYKNGVAIAGTRRGLSVTTFLLGLITVRTNSVAGTIHIMEEDIAMNGTTDKIEIWWRSTSGQTVRTFGRFMRLERTS